VGGVEYRSSLDPQRIVNIDVTFIVDGWYGDSSHEPDRPAGKPSVTAQLGRRVIFTLLPPGGSYRTAATACH
jgi:hypothetical protein